MWFAAAFAIAAMFVIAWLGGVRNYPTLHHRELDELSQWAGTHTPLQAVFHFPDHGKELYPGIFRARALRAVWVDWKGGGQVNFSEPLAFEWWRRWNSQPFHNPPPGAYIVRKGPGCPDSVFQNSRYCVTLVR
jgi:hypothetical protein